MLSSSQRAKQKSSSNNNNTRDDDHQQEQPQAVVPTAQRHGADRFSHLRSSPLTKSQLSRQQQRGFQQPETIASSMGRSVRGGDAFMDSFALPTTVSVGIVASHFPSASSYFPSTLNAKAPIPLAKEEKNRFNVLWSRRVALAPYDFARHDAADERRYLLLRRRCDELQYQSVLWAEKVQRGHDIRENSSREAMSEQNYFSQPNTVVPALVQAQFPNVSEKFPTSHQTRAIPLEKEEEQRFEPLLARREAIAQMQQNKFDATVERQERELRDFQLQQQHLNNSRQLNAQLRREALQNSVESSFFGIPTEVYPAYIAATFPSASRHFKGHPQYTEDPTVKYPLTEEEKMRFIPLWDRRADVCAFDDAARAEEADLRRELFYRHRAVRIASTNVANSARVTKNLLNKKLMAETTFGIPEEVDPREVESHFLYNKQYFNTAGTVGGYDDADEGTTNHYHQRHMLHICEESATRFEKLAYRRHQITAPRDRLRQQNAVNRRTAFLQRRVDKLQAADKRRLAKIEGVKRRRKTLFADAEEAKKHLAKQQKEKDSATAGTTTTTTTILSVLNPANLIASAAAAMTPSKSSSSATTSTSRARSSAAAPAATSSAKTLSRQRSSSLPVSTSTNANNKLSITTAAPSTPSSWLSTAKQYVVDALTPSKKSDASATSTAAPLKKAADRTLSIANSNPTSNDYYPKGYADTMILRDGNRSTTGGAVINLLSKVTGNSDNNNDAVLRQMEADEQRRDLANHRRATSLLMPLGPLPTAVSMSVIESHFPNAALAVEQFGGVFNKQKEMARAQKLKMIKKTGMTAKLDPTAAAVFSPPEETILVDGIDPTIDALYEDSIRRQKPIFVLSSDSAADKNYKTIANSANTIPRDVEEVIRFARSDIRREVMANEIDRQRFDNSVARGEELLQEKQDAMATKNAIWLAKSTKMRAFAENKAKQVDVSSDIRQKKATAQREALKENRVWQLKEDDKLRNFKRKRQSTSSEESAAALKASCKSLNAAVSTRRGLLLADRVGKLKAADKDRKARGKAALSKRRALVKQLSREQSSAAAITRNYEQYSQQELDGIFASDRAAIEAEEKSLRNAIESAALRIQKEILSAHNLGLADVKNRDLEMFNIRLAMNKERMAVEEAQKAERAMYMKNLQKNLAAEQKVVIDAETAARGKVVVPAEASEFKTLSKEESAQRSTLKKNAKKDHHQTPSNSSNGVGLLSAFGIGSSNKDEATKKADTTKSLSRSSAAASSAKTLALLQKEEATIREKSIAAYETAEYKLIIDEEEKEIKLLDKLAKERRLELAKLQKELAETNKQIAAKAKALGLKEIPTTSAAVVVVPSVTATTAAPSSSTGAAPRTPSPRVRATSPSPKPNNSKKVNGSDKAISAPTATAPILSTTSSNANPLQRIESNGNDNYYSPPPASSSSNAQLFSIANVSPSPAAAGWVATPSNRTNPTAAAAAGVGRAASSDDIFLDAPNVPHHTIHNTSEKEMAKLQLLNPNVTVGSNDNTIGRNTDANNNNNNNNKLLPVLSPPTSANAVTSVYTPTNMSTTVNPNGGGGVDGAVIPIPSAYATTNHHNSSNNFTTNGDQYLPQHQQPGSFALPGSNNSIPNRHPAASSTTVPYATSVDSLKNDVVIRPVAVVSQPHSTWGATRDVIHHHNNNNSTTNHHHNDVAAAPDFSSSAAAEIAEGRGGAPVVVTVHPASANDHHTINLTNGKKDTTTTPNNRPFKKEDKVKSKRFCC